jgi:hypothetical protein
VSYTSNVMMRLYSRCCSEHRQADRENDSPNRHPLKNAPRV